jgi:hypothetical protein
VDLFAHHQQYDLRTPFPLSMKDVWDFQPYVT